MQPLSVKIDLETVTPLFLGGAASRGRPELRPPKYSRRPALLVARRAGWGARRRSAGPSSGRGSVFGSTDEEMGGVSG